MTHYDRALKTYANSGLRTADDWAALGRAVPLESKPRADTTVRGALLPLYTRDQTERVRSSHQPAS